MTATQGSDVVVVIELTTTTVLVGTANVVVVVAVVVVEVDWLPLCLMSRLNLIRSLCCLSLSLSMWMPGAVEVDVPVDAEAVEVAEVVEDIEEVGLVDVVDDWDVVLEAVVETVDVDASCRGDC